MESISNTIKYNYKSVLTLSNHRKRVRFLIYTTTVSYFFPICKLTNLVPQEGDDSYKNVCFNNFPVGFSNSILCKNEQVWYIFISECPSFPLKGFVSISSLKLIKIPLFS